MSTLDNLRGRSTVLNLTNQSGAARSPGDLVVIDTSNDNAFTTSVSSNTVGWVGVVDEAIGVASNGRVVVSGYAQYVKTLGTSARGDYLYHSTTAATAAHMAGTTPQAGAFGQVIDGGAGINTEAYIFPTVQAGGSTISYASNSNGVGGTNAAGASTLVSRADHVHAGVSSISHTSNTFTGAVTLTASGIVGITSPSAGTFNLSAAATGGSGGSFSADANMDWTIAFIPIFAKAQTNWNSHTGADGSMYVNYGRESSGAQNAEITWDVALAAGTWSIGVVHIKGTDRGIISVQLDTVEVGTIDTYNGSLSRNNLGTVTGITVATTGKKELKFKMATKNASSSSYYGTVNYIHLWRTA